MLEGKKNLSFLHCSLLVNIRWQDIKGTLIPQISDSHYPQHHLSFTMPQSDSSLSLQGKVALVTGSGKTRGIGAAIATLLAHHGAAVILNYVSLSTAPSAATVVESITAAGGQALAIQADISRPDGAQKLVQKAVDAFGRLDILGMSTEISISQALTLANLDQSTTPLLALRDRYSALLPKL